MIQAAFTPDQVVIAFDLHGVVSNIDYKKVCQIGIQNPVSVGKLFLFFFNPWFLCDVYRLWRGHAVAAAYLELLHQKYPFLVSTIPFFIAVGNAQIPNAGLIEVIQSLKRAGYKVHLFSNIGDMIMQDYELRYPEVISLFHKICITHQKDGYVGKPYKESFLNYQRICNPEHKQVIFIDNSIRNSTAAISFGMIGIYYQSVRQVRDELSQLLSVPLS